jgi:cobalt/nickel transport system ATP-binding protein
MTPPVLALEDVTYTYPDGSPGLVGCSLAIARGSRTAILGLNGSGKTTLCLHLNGLLRPQAGTVWFDGAPLDYSRQGLKALRTRVGLVFQNPETQLLSASVLEDVSFGPMNLGLPRAEVRDRVEAALAAVGLAEAAAKPVHNLSFGQKKRVCLAGVLAMQPEVILLDEPFAGLDVPMQRELRHILDRLWQQGLTLLVCSHDLDFAYEWADQWHILAGGQLAASFNPSQIPAALPRLAELGLGLPKVAELYQQLVAAGWLRENGPPPRGHGELLARLRPAATGPPPAVPRPEDSRQ